MQERLVLNICAVDYGKTRNWLSIETYVARFDINRLFRIDFCGTELSDGLPITDEIRAKIMGALVEKFGYAPYNLEEARAEVKRNPSIIVTFDRIR